MKNETKLKKLEAWLDENNFSHHVPRSLERGVKGSPNLIITPFGNHRINVKIAGDDDSLFYDRHRGKHPVFIRDSETPKKICARKGAERYHRADEEGERLYSAYS